MNITKMRTRLVKRCLLLVLCGVGIALQAVTTYALDPKKAITQYIHDLWTSDNGLPQNNARAIVQTRDGYLWLGTEEGLARFDGVRFVIFDRSNTPEMKSRWISALIEDRNGNLWIGTNREVLSFKDGKFTRYDTKNGLSSSFVNVFCQDLEGNLWIGTNDGLNQFKDGKFTAWTTKEGLSHNAVHSIYQGKAGDLWIGTDMGLDQFKRGRFTNYTSKQGLAPGTVYSICEDRNGSLWIGTQMGDANKGGLTQFKNGKFKVFTTKDGLSFNGISSIFEDHDGNLWIGTFVGGLNRLQDNKFSTYTVKEGLSDNFVSSMYEDREGSLWMGTGTGLNRLRDSKFNTYSQTDGLSGEYVESIYEDRNGSLWIGTDDGLNKSTSGKITSFSTKEGLSSNNVRAIKQDTENNFWIGTDAGLNHLRQGGGKISATRDGPANDHVQSIYQDQVGNLWIGTVGNGLWQTKNGLYTHYTMKEGLSGRDVFATYSDRRGDLWIGTGRGLNQLHNGNLVNYTAQMGLSTSVRYLYGDQQSFLWIGTDNGLFLFNNEHFTRYTTSEGLFDDVVWTILEDNRGNFWMSCNKGIFRTTRQELIDFAAGKIKSISCIAYGTADGMKNRECSDNQQSGLKTKDGGLWFATVKGVVVIDPANLHLNTVPPPVVIEQVNVDGASLPHNTAAQLPPGQRNFEFQYAGLSFVAPEKVSYKYRLEGYDHDWIAAGGRRAAYYTNLAPGQYRFRVIAANNDGVWNETGAAFSFYLKPHFYQTWWFYSFCGLGLVFSGIGLNSLRLRGVLAKERERTRLQEAELRAEVAESQAKAIEAEHQRKTQELEEARQLQLSMLPRNVPQSPRLEIAAYMKTASEVGGDYYDFHLGEDGTLTIAVGDATGHGLRAGTLVSSVKSLFVALAYHPDIPHILQRMSRVLKEMKLRGLFMAMTLVKVHGQQLSVSIAGMPPVLIYRALTGAVEEIALRALPLGSLMGYQYKQAEATLNAGDVVVLLSDGLPERFNPQDEMFDYAATKRALAEAASQSPQQLIEHLVAAGEAWAQGRAQDDDVTFVVLKVKANDAQNG
ncbi:MAG: SpoIIE family protein phosphatase [Acidobacteria bacterium]|nr:SpoIIE family protein phosphatase [Acidobacteriota bacterium]MBI3423877.1 SpoIIE family protein phosphatase [Acidobacteriota bacterium]